MSAGACTAVGVAGPIDALSCAQPRCAPTMRSRWGCRMSGAERVPLTGAEMDRWAALASDPLACAGDGGRRGDRPGVGDRGRFRRVDPASGDAPPARRDARHAPADDLASRSAGPLDDPAPPPRGGRLGPPAGSASAAAGGTRGRLRRRPGRTAARCAQTPTVVMAAAHRRRGRRAPGGAGRATEPGDRAGGTRRHQ